LQKPYSSLSIESSFNMKAKIIFTLFLSTALMIFLYEFHDKSALFNFYNIEWDHTKYDPWSLSFANKTSYILLQYQTNTTDNSHRNNIVCDCQTESNRTVFSCVLEEYPDVNDTVVMHCSSERAFYVRDSTQGSFLGTFVRMTSSTAIDTFFLYWNSSISSWTGTYSQGCFTGSNLHAAVYIYMRSPSRESILERKSCLSPSFFSPFVFKWGNDEPEKQCSDTAWTWNVTDSSNLNELSFFSACPPRADYITAYQGLRVYIPSIHWPEKESMRRKSDPRSVCFYGDSQMRNLMNTILWLIDEKSCDPIEMQAGRASCSMPGFSFQGMHFDFDWKSEWDANLVQCSHVFVNYGQWPGSWAAEQHAPPGPWSFERYSQSIEQFARKLNYTKSNHPETKFYFLSTNLHSFSSLMTPCPVQDFRFPHVIEEYNRAACASLARVSKNVGYLDTNVVIRPLFDLSFDCAHYQGPVGVAVANLIGQIIYE
jgi:hypothetical protein